MKHDAAINLAAQYDFFPGSTRIDGGKHQMILGALDCSHKAVHNLCVHPFENPCIIGVEESETMCEHARDCSIAEVWAVAHFAGKPSNALGRFGTSPMRFFDVATQYSRDSRT